MKRALIILNTPYPYYIPFSRSIKLLVFFSIIVPVFLITFEPFGISKSSCEWLNTVLAGLSIPIFATLAINFYGVAKLVPQFFNEQNWSIGKEAVWSLWNFFTIVATTSIYWTIIPICASSSGLWAEQLMRAFLIGLLPGTFCIYFNYSRALKRKLKKARSLNASLQEKIAYYEHGRLTLKGESNAETVSLSTDQLLLIQSYDNYAKLISDSSEKSSGQLIRSSLKHLESQIHFPFIVRCHRSFIINLAKVEDVEGNARDFKIKIKNHPEWIPVSREAYRKITSLFEEYAPQTNVPISFASDKSSTQQSEALPR